MILNNVKQFQVGTQIFAIPTGNAARANKEKYITFNVEAVKRKYVELKRSDWSWSDNYCPKTGASQKDISQGYSSNSGFIFFDSIEAIENYKAVSKQWDLIISFFGSRWSKDEILDEDITSIYKIIKKYEN